MKILHTVEFYHPSVGGMQEVVKQLSELLVKSGHQVTVATTRLKGRQNLRTINGVHVEEFDVHGNLAIGMTGEIERYQHFLLNSNFDVITNFAAQQWTSDAMLIILDRIRARKVFVPTGFSRLNTPLYRQYFDRMSSWMKQYDMNVFLSDDYQDVNFARKYGVSNTVLIPNGASKSEFSFYPDIDIRQQLKIPHDAVLVLHVGSHTGTKGHIEALKIFSRADLTNAVFLIVANDLKGGCVHSCHWRSRIFNLLPACVRGKKNIIVTSLSRKETIAAYQVADLFLFPSNIECSPLVLFECMASRTPFLTTEVGNAAEIINWSGGGCLLPTSRDKKGFSRADIPASVHMLEEVANNKLLREQMSGAGYNAWLKKFTWELIAKEYEKLYYRVIEGAK